MMETLGIRVAEPSDASIIISLMKNLSHESNTVVIDPNLAHLTIAQEAQQLRVINHTLGNVVMILANSRKAIGIVTIQELHSGIGELGIAVRKPFWHQGCATALMQEAIRWFQTYSNLQQLYLTVEKQNRWAVKLYQQNGFKITKTIQQSLHSHLIDIYQMKRK